MPYTFDLPSNWVYVGYEDGTYENVANTDELSRAEANEYRLRWEKARGKKVITVVLVTPRHSLIKRFNYKGGSK